MRGLIGFRQSCQIFILFILSTCYAQDSDWQPLTELFGDSKVPYHGVSHSGAEEYLDQGYQQDSKEQCELYKVGFTQDLYFQYIRYKIHMPELKEFTLCYWAKFNNHSNDHPVFSYAVDGQPKSILAWISNTDRSSYFSMSVDGHTFYRLNYPLRLNKWYHTCQSWNGKTGEWQIWVDAERVGRGFHNRLVGHTIPSGGIAITGQEQSQLGGGFFEGKDAPKGSGGMLGEVTMLQLYSVALTAGKAHKDHKHHHAHQYDHNGNMITTPAPTTPSTRSRVPQHPLLTGGQLNRGLRINFAGGQQQPQPQPQPQLVQGQQYNVQFLNGQFVENRVTQQFGARAPPAPSQQQLEQFVLPQQLQTKPQPQQSIAVYPEQSSFSTQQISFRNTPLVNTALSHGQLLSPANVHFVDNTQLDSVSLKKRDTSAADNTNSDTKHKRELFLAGGTILDQGLIGGSGLYDQSLLDGLAGIGENAPILQEQKQSDEREPAEAEVKAVLNVCSGCDEEPFDKALVFGWRTVPKKLYSGAFYVPAVPQCKVF